MYTPSKVLTVPAEQWEALRDINSCALVSLSQDAIVTVKAKRYKGRLFTAFATLHTRYGGQIIAYELIPPHCYEAATYETYHDAEAIAEGGRERGDHLGLLVKVKDTKWVCGKAVRFDKGLPSTTPLSLAEANRWMEEHYSGSAINYPIKQGAWASYEGHPVRCYTANGEDARLLLYRGEKGEVQFMRISTSLALEKASAVSTHDVPMNVAVSHTGQLGMLF